MRATNCLLAEGVLTIGDLLQRTPSSLFEINNLGRGTLVEIEAALALHGLSLAVDEPFREKKTNSPKITND